MGFYQRHVLPWLIDRGMRNSAMTKLRPRIPPLATGRVLEVGVGAGLNFPYYGRTVRHLFGLEPADPLRDAAAAAAESVPFPVTLIGAGAEAIPLESASVDTIVTTWTLCSIAGLEAALCEMRRVLKPQGRLLFMEHGAAPDPEVARTQQRLAPLLRAVAGCNPDREIDRLIEGAGFAFNTIERGYLEGPRFLAYHYVGAATPR
jgi:ubiquinone/menaquinone biosynthesis C-methylase UbiE